LPAKGWSASGRFLFVQAKRKGEKQQNIIWDIKLAKLLKPQIIFKIKDFEVLHTVKFQK
jgi:hypothetical protein